MRILGTRRNLYSTNSGSNRTKLVASRKNDVGCSASFGVAAMTVLTLAALAALFAIWVYQQYRPGGLREL